MAISPIEIASHPFAMTSRNNARLNATWYSRTPARSYHMKFNSTCSREGRISREGSSEIRIGIRPSESG